MKVGILCLLLLSACNDHYYPYEYSLTWSCLSADGCERTEELELFDRMIIREDTFVFLSSRNEPYAAAGQRFGSEGLPAGCFWLYGLALFGDELEPAKICSTSDGFEMELSIPDRNPATHSQWLVEMRKLS